MSMNTCFKCGDIYDTDYQMEEINGEMVCDKCWEDNVEECSDCGIKWKNMGKSCPVCFAPKEEQP